MLLTSCHNSLHPRLYSKRFTVAIIAIFSCASHSKWLQKRWKFYQQKKWQFFKSGDLKYSFCFAWVCSLSVHTLCACVVYTVHRILFITPPTAIIFPLRRHLYITIVCLLYVYYLNVLIWLFGDVLFILFLLSVISLFFHSQFHHRRLTLSMPNMMIVRQNSIVFSGVVCCHSEIQLWNLCTEMKRKKKQTTSKNIIPL